VESERGEQNDNAGNFATISKEVHATEQDGGTEDAQVADQRESHEGIAAAGRTR
jgi:hypothetical protein